MWSIILTCISLLHYVSAKTSYQSDLSITDNYYASVTIEVGTPGQSLDVLIDSLNTVTFVMSNNTQDITSDQDQFITSKSSTWQSSQTTFSYSYENATTNGTTGTDTLQVANLNVTSQTIGIADYNQDLFETEELSGALSLARTGDFVTKLKSYSSDVPAKMTIDLDGERIHMGSYSTSYKNESTYDCYTSNSNVSDYWTFSLDSMNTDSIASLLPITCNSNCFGVIDSASPYITFSMSKSSFNSLFDNIGGKDNCDYSTLSCDDDDDIAAYIEFYVGNDSYIMGQDDIYYDDELKIQWTPALINGGIVIFFGKPFLQTLDVTLNAVNNTITFSYTKSNNNDDKWITVVIVLACVAGFALIFFGIFFWKFKIPPPSRARGNQEEQSLLRGQPARAQPHQPLGQPAQPPPRPVPPPEPAQVVGSANGSAQPTDPDEIRRRRLQFLESQQQQAQQDE